MKNPVANARRRLFRGQPPGAAPGVLKEVPDAYATKIHCVDYRPDSFEVTSLEAMRDRARDPTSVTWVDAIGLKDTALLGEIASIFDLPALAMEDVTSTHQRSKVDEYPAVTYVVIRLPWQDHSKEEIRFEQISLFISDAFVVSFQETEADAFDQVRARLQREDTPVRNNRADFLGYALMDAVVDHYFPVMHAVEGEIDTLEEKVFSRTGGDVMPQLLEIRRTLAFLRRAARPLQEALSELLEDRVTTRFSAPTKLYLRDTLDHTSRILDSIESAGEISAGLTDVQSSVISQRLNEVMKVLTIISVVFIPLSFIAGLYGMNFDTRMSTNMPELSWKYGYAFAIGLMATSTLGFLGFFWRRGWIGRGAS